MKLFRLTPVLLVAVIVFLAACGKSAKDQIVKKWQVTDLSGKKFADVPDSTKKRMVTDATMEFKKDGTYQMIGMGSSGQVGTYKVGDDGKTLYTNENGSTTTDSLLIKEISADKLIVTDKQGDVTVSFK